MGPLLVSAPPPCPGPRPVVQRAPRAEDTAPPCRVDTTYGHQPRICVPDVYRTVGLVVVREQQNVLEGEFLLNF